MKGATVFEPKTEPTKPLRFFSDANALLSNPSSGSCADYWRVVLLPSSLVNLGSVNLFIVSFLLVVSVLAESLQA